MDFSGLTANPLDTTSSQGTGGGGNQLSSHGWPSPNMPPGHLDPGKGGANKSGLDVSSHFNLSSHDNDTTIQTNEDDGCP